MYHFYFLRVGVSVGTFPGDRSYGYTGETGDIFFGLMAEIYISLTYFSGNGGTKFSKKIRFFK
jgi:hypothetical protein